MLGDLADEPLALVCKTDDARGEPRALGVGQYLGAAAFHDRDDGVGGPEVDSNDLCHDVWLLLLAWGSARSTVARDGAPMRDYSASRVPQSAETPRISKLRLRRSLHRGRTWCRGLAEPRLPP